MDSFMERAVALAADNVRQGGQPFGAVLVKDGRILAEGVNELHLVHDVSGHAELLAIRRAQQKLQTDDLSDCIMYASGEPCAMCFTAMAFAGIRRVYYCASVEEAEKAGLGKSKEIYEDLRKPREERSGITMIRMPLRDGHADPMSLWRERQML
jgi:tRNA(Arg) A34 adenosine deaminase TadA